MRPSFLISVAAAALSACGQPASTPSGPEPTPPASPQPPGGPATPAAPPPAPSILQPVVRADWESRLEPGAGCNLSRDGADYVVVVAGDGVARIGGGVVDLSGVPTTFDTLVVPGRYAAGGTTIVLSAAPDLGEGDAVDETFTKPVRVEVTSGGRTERFEASWTCGA